MLILYLIAALSTFPAALYIIIEKFILRGNTPVVGARFAFNSSFHRLRTIWQFWTVFGSFSSWVPKLLKHSSPIRILRTFSTLEWRIIFACLVLTVYQYRYLQDTHLDIPTDRLCFCCSPYVEYKLLGPYLRDPCWLFTWVFPSNRFGLTECLLLTVVLISWPWIPQSVRATRENPQMDWRQTEPFGKTTTLCVRWPKDIRPLWCFADYKHRWSKCTTYELFGIHAAPGSLRNMVF